MCRIRGSRSGSRRITCAGFYFTNLRFRRWKYRLIDRPKSRVTALRARGLSSVHAWADAIANCRNRVVHREDEPGVGRVEQLRAALLASSQWSPGMVPAWKAIAADERVEFSGEAFGFGVVRIRL